MKGQKIVAANNEQLAIYTYYYSYLLYFCLFIIWI